MSVSLVKIFNNKVFSAFITVKEAEIIRKAVGIKSSSLHRITFDRSTDDKLSITCEENKGKCKKKLCTKRKLNSLFIIGVLA